MTIWQFFLLAASLPIVGLAAYTAYQASQPIPRYPSQGVVWGCLIVAGVLVVLYNPLRILNL